MVFKKIYKYHFSGLDGAVMAGGDAALEPQVTKVVSALGHRGFKNHICSGVEGKLQFF